MLIKAEMMIEAEGSFRNGTSDNHAMRGTAAAALESKDGNFTVHQLVTDKERERECLSVSVTESGQDIQMD